MPESIIVRYLYFFIVLVISFASCGEAPEEEDSLPANGEWLGKLLLTGGDYIPFNFTIQDSLFVISNSKERIATTILKEDSLRCHLPIFGSNLVFSLINPSEIRGYWHREEDRSKSIFFSATHQLTSFDRFNHSSLKPKINFQGKWETTFSHNSNSYPAIGLFEQSENVVTGTFLTETGDYRYLEGNVIGDSLFLSCFDGAHAFLFAAVRFGDSLRGVFRSGKHYVDDCWLAVKNDTIGLSDPDSLTAILDIEQPLSFSFSGVNAGLVRYSKGAFLGRVVILQLFGSWCPNCMDEAAFLSQLYRDNHQNGLEIFGLAFERPQPILKQQKRMSSYINTLKIPYPIAIAGSSSKSDASNLFPQIGKITSFPTCIFIDKFGNVAKVHTGFYGPGTGPYYVDYIKKTHLFIQHLLAQ